MLTLIMPALELRAAAVVVLALLQHPAVLEL
jgi:hypothetical protein